MGTLAADLRFALRTMRTNRGFTAVAVATLALGIGATTAMFTVVNRVMLDPLPYPEPDRIMRLGRQFPNGNGWSNSIPKYMTWRQNDVFESMALYDFAPLGMNFGVGDRPEPVKATRVSEGFFRVFGAQPAIGRTFSEAEDLPGSPPAAVLTERFWRNRLAADRQVVGHTILLNKQPYIVLGVMQKGFESDPAADIWLPLQADPASTNQGHYLLTVGRLKPGVELGQARAEMKVVGERFRHAYSKWMDPAESVAVAPLKDSMVEDVRLALLVLFGAVGFVLLIACANVANLLLARAAVRQKELALRAAIGATRWRMVRQLLTESVLLAGVGGIAGFALGAWGVRALLLLAPGNIPRLTDLSGAPQAIALLDWRVAAFATGVSVLTGILFGLFPALQISSPNLISALKEGGRSGGGTLGRRTRAALVVAEVALALVLLTGAGLLMRTFAGLHSVDPGFNSRNLLTMVTSLGSSYDSTAKVDNFVRQVVQRVEAIPGVQAAASCIVLPLSGNGVDLPFNIAGRTPTKGQYEGDVYWRSVSPHYFRAFQVPLLRGRTFTESDSGNTTRVVIVNQTMAKKYWKEQDPLGQVIVIGKGLGPQFDDQPRQIVGVVGDVRENNLGEKDAGVMYVPQGQVPEGLTRLANSVIPLSWAIRTASDPMAIRASVERELAAVDGIIIPARVRTMDQAISEALSRQNFNMLLLTIFAAIALLLAAIGIYGLMAYSVEQRMQEIGIRVALGAAQGDVLKLIVWQGMNLAWIGIAIGLAASYGVTRLLGSLLYGVKSSDPVTFASVAGIVALSAGLATFLPARRASGVHPSDALRHL
ncbi:MAG TPA: ABC transporter permease [Candidatus Acidoferrales bacterium]|nr:ABC transporter permease [Candidatus Acidoferrales bacterium]